MGEKERAGRGRRGRPTSMGREGRKGRRGKGKGGEMRPWCLPQPLTASAANAISSTIQAV